MKHNIEPPGKSREKELLWKLAGKVIFRNWEHELKWNPKFIKKKQKEKCAKQARKKENRNLDLFGQGSLATFLILAVW